jgi:SOS-response transcriptional repressor LexA
MKRRRGPHRKEHLNRSYSHATTEMVYEFICNYLQERGFSPSLDDIGEAVFLSRASVVRHLDRLEVQQRIIREHGQPRSISLKK